MTLSREQRGILEHTLYHAPQGLYCGDSPDMQSLVADGLMEEAGRLSFGPDLYFRITRKGKEALQQTEAVK